MKKIFASILIFGIIIAPLQFVQADDITGEIIINSPNLIVVNTLDKSLVALPFDLRSVSNIYELRTDTMEATGTITIKPSVSSVDYQQVFQFNAVSSTWQALPTKGGDTIEIAKLTSNVAVIGIFARPTILITGHASWYAYKSGNFAASPDFPKGSQIRVYNQANGKYVDVIINDYGPDRRLHPDRAIDLDKVAFKKIANTRDGIIDVRLEPLFIPRGFNNIFPTVPDYTFTSGAIYSETAKDFVFMQNATATMPMASLTKIVAMKVFLDIGKNRNRLAEKVTYKLADEKLNYQYCKPADSGKLNLKNGDVLTIKDLLYASLIKSANNTVESLVRVSGLSREAFIQKMNDTVIAWGATSTRFVEPSGLSIDNFTTAKDYALISSKVFADPLISKISIMPSYSFSLISNKKKKYSFRNWDELVKSFKYKILGSKTGYIDEAGYCLTVLFEDSGKRYVAIVLGSPTRAKSVSDMEKLLRINR